MKLHGCLLVQRIRHGCGPFSPVVIATDDPAAHPDANPFELLANTAAVGDPAATGHTDRTVVRSRASTQMFGLVCAIPVKSERFR